MQTNCGRTSRTSHAAPDIRSSRRSAGDHVSFVGVVDHLSDLDSGIVPARHRLSELDWRIQA